jgi:cytosine deaminase
MSTLLLTGGTDEHGAPLDLRCDAATGLVVERSGVDGPLRPRTDGTDEETVDCTGMVLVPAPVEPHAHLDKALSGDAAPNPAGDLPGAIAAWRAHRATLDDEDLARRARAAALELVAHGTTTIRTHVDVGPGIGLRGLEVVAALRDELRAAGLCEIQVVALVTPPVTGPGEGAEMRALLREAMERGADVVGGCPHVDPDPDAATHELVAIAAELGMPLDLHVDEQLDPQALWVRDMAADVVAAGDGAIPGGVASHCVSLGVQDEATQAAVAGELADAGLAVVTLPQTNLYLQARHRPSSPPRGLTAIRALLDAGVVVAAGADNVRDPFNAVGRSCALETAALLVMAAHLTPAEAWHAVSVAARAAIGVAPTALMPGDPAEVLALRGSSLTDAIARASDERIVVHRGRVVATTTVSTVLRPSRPDPGAPPVSPAPGARTPTPTALA